VNNVAELRLSRVARPSAIKSLRHAFIAFLYANDISEDCAADIATAVGEALANSAEHAYGETNLGTVEVYARFERGSLIVEVADGGVFVERPRREDRGFGLRIIKAVARSVSIECDGGTRVRMVFDARFVPQTLEASLP
jgi:anti-sigma regulatory factor (Ser/Thr protein kinase)